MRRAWHGLETRRILFSLPDIGNGGENKTNTSSDASREVRRMNLKGYNEGGETARTGSVLLLRPL